MSTMCICILNLLKIPIASTQILLPGIQITWQISKANWSHGDI